MTDVYIKTPEPLVNENSSFTATAYFRSGGTASASATNSQYRVDNLSTGKELKDWTSLTPAVSINISILSAWNKIQDDSNDFEEMQLTVASDRGETGATYSNVTWKVKNIYGYIKNA